MKRITIEFEDARTNSLGHRHFSAVWTQNGKKRGQHFFAKLEDHITKWKRDGYRVTIKPDAFASRSPSR